MNYIVSTPSDVKKLMKDLSSKLKCGERVEITLTNEELIALVPPEAISRGLSVVDAYEFGGNIIVTVENRFVKCK